MQRYKGPVLLGLLLIGLLLVIISQKEKLPKPHSVAVGLEVPDFVVLDKDGRRYTKENLKGKTVFLHFWASWCRECRQEMPEIVEIYKRKRSDPNFVFLAVVYNEDPADSRSYLQREGYDIPIFVDPGGKTAQAFGVTGVPETYIIDPEGVLKKKVIGPANWRDYPL